MFQFEEQVIIDMVARSRKLLGELMASPLWPLIQDEPVITDWIKSIEALDEKLKSKS